MAESTLIIDTADLPSLTAVALQGDADAFVLWHPHVPGETAERRQQMAQRHAEVFGAARLIITDLKTAPVPGPDAPPWWVESAVLLHAMAVAERLQCPRIIWPRQIGDDFERLAPVIDRATLISGLQPGERGQEAAIIELPLLDLTEAQVVELADDAGADLSLHWPCAAGGEEPCGACSGCQRWRAAFEAAGPAWPWERAGANRGRERIVRTSVGGS